MEAGHWLSDISDLASVTPSTAFAVYILAGRSFVLNRDAKGFAVTNFQDVTATFYNKLAVNLIPTIKPFHQILIYNGQYLEFVNINSDIQIILKQNDFTKLISQRMNQLVIKEMAIVHKLKALDQFVSQRSIRSLSEWLFGDTQCKQLINVSN